MADLPALRELEPNADPAALAFEALREEVALLRRAIAGLAAERAAIEIPDYSETLGKIMSASAAAAANMKVLARLPILHAAVHDWAHAIEQASEPARRHDRQTLADIHGQLRKVTTDISARLRSARTAETQRRWLVWAFGGGALAGMLLSALLMATFAHA